MFIPNRQGYEIQKQVIRDHHRWADNEELARIATPKPIKRFSPITFLTALWLRRPRLLVKSTFVQMQTPTASTTPLRHR